MNKKKSSPAPPLPKAKSATQPEQRFWQLLGQRKWEILVLGVLTLGAYFVIHYYYPTMAHNGDTTHYLDCAYSKHLDVYRPFGYSVALIFFRIFSDTLVSIFKFQLLIHFVTSVLFCYTIRFFFPPANKTQARLHTAFLFATTLSPAVLYLANYLISDSVFISLTMLWLTTLIWLLYQRNVLMSLLHLAILFATMEVRYTGMFYPLFSTIVLILAYRKSALIFLSVIPPALILFVYFSVSRQMREVSKVKLFSAFSGWQSASNALHLIPYTDIQPDAFKHPDLRWLHTTVKSLPDSVYRVEGVTASFMWDAKLPLKVFFVRYMDLHEMGYMEAWARVSLLYDEYGKILMVKHPFLYFRYFILPNLRGVFYPYSTEMFEDAKPMYANNVWLTSEEDVYTAPLNDIYNKYYFPILPFLVFVLWLAVFVALGFLWVNRKTRRFNVAQRQILQLMIGFSVVYVGFHVYAAPSAIRYLLGIHGLQLAVLLIAAQSYLNRKNTGTQAS